MSFTHLYFCVQNIPHDNNNVETSITKYKKGILKENFLFIKKFYHAFQ